MASWIKVITAQRFNYLYNLISFYTSKQLEASTAHEVEASFKLKVEVAFILKGSIKVEPISCFLRISKSMDGYTKYTA